MKLVIVSGLSGSGKTVALHALEDEGYYCVDNLPLGLLTAFVDELLERKLRLYDQAAVGIDARSGVEELERFPQIVEEIRSRGVDLDIIFLQAEVETLLKRFNETRRRHPLSRKGLPLIEAVHLERSLLTHISNCADLIIDTTRTNVHELNSMLRQRVGLRETGNLSIQFQSFGFKHGTPADSDFVFDIRCLPNPHWEPRLRQHTGLDQPVMDFLEGHALVEKMFSMITRFLETWLPEFEAGNRRYLSVSIGCTGGQHRSVYMAERLAAHFRGGYGEQVNVRHRELN
ncbi:MAG: RNase adapter RapZ [Gammaproteobacteria bacterium]|jgi:RNase adapter protein RapZ